MDKIIIKGARENNLKNINIEMEEAQNEFSKLFQSNDYQK